MKRILIISVLFIMFSKLDAQPERMEMMRERMESMKIAFLTNELQLTSSEAQKFWPVYNEFQSEMDELKFGKHPPEFNRKQDPLADLSDKEVESMLDKRLEDEQKILDVKKKYLTRFKEVLPVKKVAKLFRSEEEFKRRLLEEFKKRREAH